MTSKAALLLSAFSSGLAHASAPPVLRELPGTTKGEAESRWIAPYALATSHFVGGKGSTTIRWFDERGRVSRELSGCQIDARTDFICERSAGRATFHDVNGKWQLVLPEKPGPSGSITAVGDTFVHQFHAVEGQIAADIYLAGRLVGSIGPFVRYRGRDVCLAYDGSSALLTWKTPSRKAIEVVVVTPGGNVSFRAECGEDVGRPYPVRGGRGVLLEVTDRKEPPVRFCYLETRGRSTILEVGANAFPVACTPVVGTVLFRTAIGGKVRFRLVNCATGQTLWEIPSPVQKYESIVSGAAVVEDKILLLGKDLAAVNIRNGKVISLWQPDVSRSNRGRMVRQGKRLFLVTDKAFAEISLADITAKKNGWR